MWVAFFHNVVPGPLDEFDRRLSRLSVAQFEGQVAFLARHLRLISLAELLARHQSGDDDPRAVTVTFDDGYRGVLAHAAPVLAAAGTTATVFLVTETLTDPEDHLFHFEEIELAFRRTAEEALALELLDERLPLRSTAERVLAMKKLKKRLKLLPEAERRHWHETALARLGVSPRACREAASDLPGRGAYAVLDRGELERLLEAGWSLGGHTRTHRTLSQLDPADLESETAGCHDDLERHLRLPAGGPGLPFAYPYGRPEHVGPAATAAVAAAGFGCAFTTDPVPLTPAAGRFALPRLEFHELWRALAPALAGSRAAGTPATPVTPTTPAGTP